MSFFAGAVVRDVTPQTPQFLVGYPHVPRVFEGIHDPLSASAVYLKNEETAFLWIAVDIIFVSPETVGACRSDLNRATGVPTKNILISATHTHSGPVTNSVLAWQNDSVVPPPDPSYMGKLHEGIIESGIAAYRAAQPAKVAVMSAQADGVGGNRHNPDGPHDPEIGLIAIQNQTDGRLIALVVIYGMHPTVLHEDSRLVSSDFPHFTRELLRREYPGAVISYHLGPCGNLSPRYHVKAQTFSEAKRLGERLGDSILKAMREFKGLDYLSDQHLSARQIHTVLPVNSFEPVALAQQKLDKAVEHYQRLKSDGSPRGPLRTAECDVFGREEALTLAKAQANGELAKWLARYHSAEVQVFRLGSVFIVAWPGEQFVEYALELKRKAGRRVFIISLANGELQGYIATPAAAEAGSYEAAFSLFKAQAGNCLVEAALQLIKELAQ